MDGANPPSRGWQVADALWGLLFAYAAVVNLNDPDPMLWLVLYGTGVGICAMDATGWLSHRGALVFGIANGILAAMIASQGIEESHPMKGFPQYGVFREEIVRESLGVGLMALWALVIGVRRWREGSAAADVSASD